MTKTNTTWSEEEIRRRLDTLNDLYVVARDCMEDLIHMQPAVEDDTNNNNVDEDDDTEEFLQNVTFVQDSVEAVLMEYNEVLNNVQDHPEQRDRIMKQYGLKMKQLELEMAMLLQGIDDEENDDEIDHDVNDISGDSDNDEEDDMEYDDEDDDGDEDEDELVDKQKK